MKRSRVWVGVICLLSLSMGSIGLAADFEDNGDGTVVDHDTGLIWQQGESAMKDWETACAYCASLSLAGQNDWRLPNIEELKSIIDYNKYDPAIDTTFFPDFPNVDHSYYWSSTTHNNMASYAGAVHFFSGGFGYGYMGGEHFVRCVRGGRVNQGREEVPPTSPIFLPWASCHRLSTMCWQHNFAAKRWGGNRTWRSVAACCPTSATAQATFRKEEKL